MPTTYTHYRFGKDVLKNLPEPIKREAEAKRELFDTGLHGPDIFFYYHPLGNDPVHMKGEILHKEYADGFFSRAARVIGKSDDIGAARAYINGFICHFALDSGMHGYIEKIIQVSGISHIVIEREFDRFLMSVDGLDPLTYVPTGHIAANKETARVMAPFFEGIDEGTMEKILLSMRKYLSMLLPLGPLKKAAVKLIFRAAGCYESHFGVFMLKKADPKCAPYLDILLRLYREAVPRAVELIRRYQRFLLKKEDLGPGFHKTFEAGEHWKELVLQC